MNIGNAGSRFESYQQYCDVMDKAIATISTPLMNGLPMAGETRQLIESKRLFYICNPDHILVFTAYSEYLKLYYAAAEDAVLRIPPTSIPVVADQLRLDSRDYPRDDALMVRSGFTLDRVNVGMERMLSSDLRREDYLTGEVPENIAVGFAVPEDLAEVECLLRRVFDPVLDELPSQNELYAMIKNEHVFVLRDRRTIAALMIRMPKGAAVMMHWIVVNEKYRRLKLSGALAFAGDSDSRNQGYKKITIWVNRMADKWIQTISRRRYVLTGQSLYTYVFHPKVSKG
jgi:hypothetical protein